MLSLFSNMAAAIKFAKYAALIPMVISLVKSVEALADDSTPGDEKRAAVVAGAVALVNAFVKKGFLPPELGETISKDIGELTDVIVEVFHAVGIFKHAPASAAGSR